MYAKIYFYAKRCSLSSNKQSQLGPKRQILRFSVTQGTNINNGEEVAIKFEDVSIVPFLLEGEAFTYRSLSGDIGIPRVYAYETECGYNFTVFDLLGPSLEDHFNFGGHEFSHKTTLMLISQLLYRLE